MKVPGEDDTGSTSQGLEAPEGPDVLESSGEPLDHPDEPGATGPAQETEVSSVSANPIPTPTAETPSHTGNPILDNTMSPAATARSAVQPAIPRLFEDCYPPRREWEVRLLRRQREKHYQLELLHQMEEKACRRQQQRRDEIHADLQRLGRVDRHDEYVSQMHAERKRLMREQLQGQWQREDQREDQRMKQVEQDREQQREVIRGHNRDGAVGSSDPVPQNQEVEHLREQLEKQHLPDDDRGETVGARTAPPSRVKSVCGAAGRGDAPEAITEGVMDKVNLDQRRPWNHYRALQRELISRRQTRAAIEAAREATERARADYEYSRHSDRRRRGADPAVARCRVEGGEEAEKKTSPQQRVQWRCAKQEEARERRGVARKAAAEKQSRGHDSFTRWLNTIYDRKLAQLAGPVGATGVTTYEAFHAAPWNKPQRGRRKSVG